MLAASLLSLQACEADVVVVDEFPIALDGQVAYVSSRGLSTPSFGHQLFVLNADQHATVQLTEFETPVTDPDFAPDGSRIVFGHEGSLWLISVDGTGLTQITPREVHSGAQPDRPQWSPDGSRIAYVQDDDVFLMDADGSSPVNLTDHPAREGWPTWSPDGVWLAFTSDRNGRNQLFATDIGGVDTIRLTSGDRGTDYSPSWGPLP